MAYSERTAQSCPRWPSRAPASRRWALCHTPGNFNASLGGNFFQALDTNEAQWMVIDRDLLGSAQPNE